MLAGAGAAGPAEAHVGGITAGRGAAGGGRAAEEVPEGEETLFFHCWGFIGDTPARQKAGNFCGISKRWVCTFCRKGAVYIVGPGGSRGGALRPMGYDKPQFEER